MPHRHVHVALSRREMLARCANGFGALALTGLLAGRSFAGLAASPRDVRPPHFRPRARNVIFLYMDGGPSQVDTFDPKPRLDREQGQPIKMETPDTQFDDKGMVLASPWKFERHGASGLPVSELFPYVAKRADDLCVVRSMTSNFPEHTSANYFLQVDKQSP